MGLVQAGTKGTVNIRGSKYTFYLPVFRQSNLKDYHACHRLFFFRHVLGLSPRVEKRSIAADTGTFWHKAMQAAYQAIGHDTLWEEVSVAVDALHQSLLGPLEAKQAEDLTGEVEKQIADLKMCHHKGLIMARIFFDQFPLRPGLEVVATEEPLLVPFKLSLGEDVLVRTRPDLILRADDRLWVVDHKSSGDPPADVMVGKPWSFQTRLYAWAVLNHYQEGLGGFIYNKMQIPGIRLCKTDEKNLEKNPDHWGPTVEDAYLKRVAAWYEKQPHRTIEGVWTPCSGEHHLDPGLQGLLEEIHSKVRTLGDVSPGPLTLFEPDGSCWNCRKFNRTCPFMALCDTDPVAWCHTIAGFYDQSFKEVNHADS